MRPAEAVDVTAMSEVMIASITDLCGLDHHNDPEAIAAWTANKTPAGVIAMLEAPGNSLFVAERDNVVAAVGCVIDRCEVALNYVHPAHRFAGVGRALLTAMESFMRERGTTQARLTSTVTAHRFYLARGWLDIDALETGGTVDTYAMTKQL